MKKFSLFISSVQAEFAAERQRLYDYLKNHTLFSQYFEPFIFEQVVAQDANPRHLYLDEAKASNVYILLVGEGYGNAAHGQLSPTQQEYMAAQEGQSYKVAFIKDLHDTQRDEREELFFRQVQKELTYRVFDNTEVLVSLLQQSLYTYLKYKGIIQEQSLDEIVRDDVSIEDIDPLKVKTFIHAARERRGFPFEETAPIVDVLTHLRLLRRGRPTNAALLAFAKDPQLFFPTAIVKCAWFLGTKAVKPIEDYQTYDGDVMEQINRATSWALSKLNMRVGVRNETAQNKAELEIPRSVIFETIVNAVAHRDYGSKGSVQVSVYRNRIVVRNPGTLPVELTLADLTREHGSYPHNPLLAEVLYQAGYIDRFGTGTIENARKMLEAHLLAPEIDLSAEFTTTIFRDNLATSDANLASNLATSGANHATSEANLATSEANLATSEANLATSGAEIVARNNKIIDEMVVAKVKKRMTRTEIEDCIISLCILERSIDELAIVLDRNKRYLRNEIIPVMVNNGMLLPTRKRHDPRQCYLTNPKFKQPHNA